MTIVSIRERSAAATGCNADRTATNSAKHGSHRSGNEILGIVPPGFCNRLTSMQMCRDDAKSNVPNSVDLGPAAIPKKAPVDHRYQHLRSADIRSAAEEITDF